MDDNAKLVARIAANSPIAFETDFDDIGNTEIQDEGSDEVITNSYTSVPRTEAPKEPPLMNQPPAEEEKEVEDVAEQPEEPAEQPPAEPETTEESDDYSEYSQAALVAMELANSHQQLFDEVPKDLDWENLLEKLDGYIAQTINAGSQYQMEKIGKANEYVKFLMDGGSPEALQEAVQHADLTQIDISDAQEDVLQDIIRTNLGLKGLSDDDIDTVIKTAKLQDKLQSKATAMQEELRARERTIMERDKQMRAYQKQQEEQQRQQIVQTINNVIEQDSIRGYPLDDRTRMELKQLIFEPNFVVKDEVNGETVTRRITGFEKLKREYNNDIESQMAFALWLMKGGDFSSVMQMGERKKSKSLIDELRKRESGAQSMPKVKSGYLQ